MRESLADLAARQIAKSNRFWRAYLEVKEQSSSIMQGKMPILTDESWDVVAESHGVVARDREARDAIAAAKEATP